MLFAARLTFRSWWRILRQVRSDSVARVLWVVDGSRLGWAAARATGWMAGIRAEPLRFRLAELRDEKGLSFELRVAYRDLSMLQDQVMATPELRSAVPPTAAAGRLRRYLSKTVASGTWFGPNTLMRTLLMIQVCARAARSAGAVSATLFLPRQPWFGEISRYAERAGVRLIPVRAPLDLAGQPWRFLTARQAAWLRYLRARGRVLHRFRRAACSAEEARIAVDDTGRFNVDAPERHSDLAFWHQSAIPGSDLVVIFRSRRDPCDGTKAAALARHGIGAVAVDPLAAKDPRMTFLRPPSPDRLPGGSPAWPGTEEGRWLRYHTGQYELLRRSWAQLFSAVGAKIYVSSDKFDAAQCAAGEAVRDVGGAAALAQLAFESHPAAWTSVDADVMFGFSRGGAETERRSGSRVPYYVITGYLGDHRARLLRPQAERLRHSLMACGASRIIALFDENSMDDPHWQAGHEAMREDYAFLLERLLEEPRLGLVLKPKIPSTLRRRLGPVAETLRSAESTGRCYVFEEGSVQGAFPPSAAALAADAAIHTHLSAGTAGMEAALAGIPTLLMDREGWTVSPLYRLGVGQVVFTSWDEAWRACREHWSRPGGMPGFGDWSPLLPELDPFRDGRAAERMGTYLGWLLEGFKARLPRDAALADAAQRYGDRWGHDKLCAVEPSEIGLGDGTESRIRQDEPVGLRG
jgi:hypothetical protein